MDKNRKLNTYLCDLLGNQKSFGYKDRIRELKVHLSTFILPDYNDFADCLSVASAKLQEYCGDFDINEIDAYDIINLLMDKDRKYQFPRKLFWIQDMITMVTYPTPKALPVLREYFGQIIIDLRIAICETATRTTSDYSPMSFAGRAWDNMKHFQKMTQHELSALMKLTDQIIPDQKAAFKAAEKLTDEYEKWASSDTLKQLHNYESAWFYESVIINESNQNLYLEIMNYLLCLEDIESIDKISRIHSELRDMTLNIQNYLKSKDDDIVTVSPGIIDTARQLAASIMDVAEKWQGSDKTVKQTPKVKKHKCKSSSKLSERETEVYRMVHAEGKTQQQAALELNCSRQNISRHLNNAEKKIAAKTSRSVSTEKAQDLPHDKRGQEIIEE